MTERANHNWLEIVSGGAEGALGFAMSIETSVIREGLKLSNSISGSEGVNWEYYSRITEQLGKPIVDGLIGYGADIGGALAIIGICEILRGIDEHDVKVISPLVAYAFAGIMGGFGVLMEIRELMVNAPINQCANIGCGSWGDLLIFSGLLAYPFLRNMNSNKNGE